MYKELFMKYENVRCLLNRKDCYGHTREELLEHCSEVYSVRVHVDDICEYTNLHFKQHVQPDARFIGLTLITDPDKRDREALR